MSTTKDLKVAIDYALGDAVGTDAVQSKTLLLRLTIGHPNQNGADLSYLSVFQHEKEFLYPPLTQLERNPKILPKHVTYGSTTFEIIDVTPWHSETT